MVLPSCGGNISTTMKLAQTEIGFLFVIVIYQIRFIYFTEVGILFVVVVYQSRFLYFTEVGILFVVVVYRSRFLVCTFVL